MVQYFSSDLIIHLIIFQMIVLLIIGSNILLTRRTRRHPQPDTWPKISVLIPARNEEDNITACVQSLLRQDYPDFEILVLDDQSTDNTKSILEEMAQAHPHLIVLAGKPTPEKVIGKNWACSQLAEVASGEYFYFTDADTVHKPDTLKAVITAMHGEEADLISGYPRQIMGSWGERFLVPFFSWAIYSFIPLGLAYHIRSLMLASAVGQLMVFKQTAYLSIGGHASVSTSIVDDLALARNIHENGFSWKVIHVADLISCRMYKDSGEAFTGFNKNLFAAFEFRLIPYLFAFTWLAIMFLEPLILLFLLIAGRAPLAQPEVIFICLMLSASIWLIPYINLGISGWLALLYPITTIISVVTAIRSFYLSQTGDLVWKDRNIQSPRWRWF